MVDSHTMSPAYWSTVRTKIADYRERLNDKNRLFDPLYYYIVFHSDQHAPTTDLLGDQFDKMMRSLPPHAKFALPKLTNDETDFFDSILSVCCVIPFSNCAHRLI